MQSSEIYQQLSGIFADVFDDDAIVLKPEMTADDVDGWDSLTHIRLIISVEKAFKITTAMTLLERWKRSPGPDAQLRYRPCTRLALVGGKVRAWPWTLGQSTPDLVELDQTPALLGLLEVSRAGGTAAELAEALRRWLPRASEAVRLRSML